MTKITIQKLRELCDVHGSPDNIPSNELSESVAAVLSQSERFLDTAEDAIEELSEYGLIEASCDLLPRG